MDSLDNYVIYIERKSEYTTVFIILYYLGYHINNFNEYDKYINLAEKKMIPNSLLKKNFKILKSSDFIKMNIGIIPKPKNTFKKFCANLIFIFKPQYWYLKEDYNYMVDYFVNDLLTQGSITEVNSATFKINNITFWNSSDPNFINFYDSFYKGRPSKLTLYKIIQLKWKS